jgi:hypothetical protein
MDNLLSDLRFALLILQLGLCVAKSFSSSQTKIIFELALGNLIGRFISRQCFAFVINTNIFILVAYYSCYIFNINKK